MPAIPGPAGLPLAEWKPGTKPPRPLAVAVLALLLAIMSVQGQPTNNGVYPIDLPAALRLAGAQNLDIQRARERLHEAEAAHQSAVEQFFPWIAPGFAYHRRDGVAQASPSGIISDAHYDSYNPGLALSAQWTFGDAIYNSLAAKQLVAASQHALETQRQDAILAAAQGYFELAKARALAEIAAEAVRISQDYQGQLHDAVGAGVAFRGDELRVQVQTEHYRVVLEQAREQEQVAAAGLAQVLHLDARLGLVAQDAGLAPLRLFTTNASIDPLVDQALHARPELKGSEASLAAARAVKKGAAYGPLIPSLSAQVFGGGLGGGPDAGPGHFGPEGDYALGLTWRIGPGGLFDPGRLNSAKARLATAEVADAQLKDTIIAQVVANQARVQSTSAQIALLEHTLATASEALRLTRDRKQFGVGAVLEDLQAQQDLVRARSDYASAIAEHNKAQYALSRALGGVAENR